MKKEFIIYGVGVSVIIAAIIVAVIMKGPEPSREALSDGNAPAAEEQSGAGEAQNGVVAPPAPAAGSGAGSGVSTEDKNNKEDKVKNFAHTITLKTSLGEIKFATYDADAPKTVDNFITLARKGFYDGLTFHRVISGFMIQGGDPTGTGMGGPGYKFEDELDPSTESYKAGYAKGTVAMANAGPNTNGSQFFIMVADYPLPHSYSIFGKVISGQEVADAISKVQRDRADKPLTPVTVSKVTVEDNAQ